MVRAIARFEEGFDQLDPLGQTLELGFRTGRRDFLAGFSYATLCIII